MRSRGKAGEVGREHVFTTLKPLILASGSPRRRRYFEDLGLDFTVRTADVEEIMLPGEGPEIFVRRMAEEKAVTIMKQHPGSWIVAADTVVFLEDLVLGKPKDGDEAVMMLMRLSGRRHCVKTGFCIGCAGEQVRLLDVATTLVDFAVFPEDIARAYVATGEPLDKAGAYGIQGRGAFLVAALTGSYSNVVGLPLHEVVTCLCRYGVIAVDQRNRVGK
jgi:nucleoside triphosphate pyrophosphatase